MRVVVATTQIKAQIVTNALAEQGRSTTGVDYRPFIRFTGTEIVVICDGGEYGSTVAAHVKRCEIIVECSEVIVEDPLTNEVVRKVPCHDNAAAISTAFDAGNSLCQEWHCRLSGKEL